MTNKRIPPGLACLLPRDGFAGASILVIGDLMLDRYVCGEAHRISPEAPVPVVTVTGERMAAGGAANVALNVAGLGARAHLVGVTGRDAMAVQLRAVLRAHGIEDAGIVADPSRPTTSKTRVLCGNHQIVRLDREVTSEIPEGIANELARLAGDRLNTGVHAVILSDYGKGVLGCALIRTVIAECAHRTIPVLVDPKKTSYAPYRGATCITPNHKEFEAALTAMHIPGGDFVRAGEALRESLHCPILLVTQGADGMTLATAGGSLHLAALAEEVFDVSGAGDTVIATMATAMGFGLEPSKAAELANIAASVVIRKAGTAPIAWEELRELLPERDADEGLPILAEIGYEHDGSPLR